MQRTREISNNDDIIDSRDIIERIEELEAEREALAEALEEAEEATEPQNLTPEIEEAQAALNEWDDSDEAAELKALKALAEEAEGYAADWKYGECLIRETYFKEYAQELAEDIGAIDPKASWPNNCIDWERAASELAMDYAVVDFAGVNYYIR